MNPDPVRLPPRADLLAEPGPAYWLEEIQPLLSAWVMRGLKSNDAACRFAACHAAAAMLPFLGAHGKPIRERALALTIELLQRTANNDFELQLRIQQLTLRLNG